MLYVITSKSINQLDTNCPEPKQYLLAILYISAPPAITAVAPTPLYISSGYSNRSLLNVSIFFTEVNRKVILYVLRR